MTTPLKSLVWAIVVALVPSFVAAQDRAWGAALTLMVLAFLVTFVARTFTARFALKR